MKRSNEIDWSKVKYVAFVIVLEDGTSWLMSKWGDPVCDLVQITIQGVKEQS